MKQIVIAVIGIVLFLVAFEAIWEYNDTYCFKSVMLQGLCASKSAARQEYRTNPEFRDAADKLFQTGDKLDQFVKDYEAKHGKLP
jgi:hypothetical protein